MENGLRGDEGWGRGTMAIGQGWKMIRDRVSVGDKWGAMSGLGVGWIFYPILSLTSLVHSCHLDEILSLMGLRTQHSSILLGRCSTCPMTLVFFLWPEIFCRKREATFCQASVLKKRLAIVNALNACMYALGRVRLNPNDNFINRISLRL